MISIRKSTERNSKKDAFRIDLQAQLFNYSASSINLQLLKTCIEEQSSRVFNFDKNTFNCVLTINVEIIRSLDQLSKKKLLFCVIDEVRNGNPAESDFKGLRIVLNKKIIPSILANTNTRTIPHELGHILGWEHPHARGKYESINPEANKVFEQSMTEAERKNNLMSQTWYIQTAGKTENQGLDITFGQLELMYRNFQSKKLNNNYHLKGILWWKRLV